MGGADLLRKRRLRKQAAASEAEERAKCEREEGWHGASKGEETKQIEVEDSKAEESRSGEEEARRLTAREAREWAN